MEFDMPPEKDVDETHPMHEKHPEHPLNTMFRSNHPHADSLRGILAVFVAFVIVLTFAVGLITNAPFGPVVLFFAPSVVLGLIGLSLLSADHFDLRFLGLGLVFLLVLGAVVFSTVVFGVDVTAMVATNLILGGLLMLIISQSYHQERSPVVELEVEEQEIPDLVKTIEDRCKAINFVIGRVYSVHRGATKGLREKLKVDAEWYNELTEALEDPDENRNIIVGVLEKIKRRLEVLSQPERNVFSDAELRNLKKLERKKDGGSTVLEVLAGNDSDPVEGYHKAALEYCLLLLERLEA